jgi:hypothetical protein
VVARAVGGGSGRLAAGRVVADPHGDLARQADAKLKVTSRVALLLHARETGWVQTRSASRR